MTCQLIGIHKITGIITVQVNSHTGMYYIIIILGCNLIIMLVLNLKVCVCSEAEWRQISDGNFAWI